jgi:hypothetical protein
MLCYYYITVNMEAIRVINVRYVTFLQDNCVRYRVTTIVYGIKVLLVIHMRICIMVRYTNHIFCVCYQRPYIYMMYTTLA